MSDRPPPPSAVAHLRPRDDVGALLVAWVAALTGLGAWLSLAGGWPAWVAGQGVLALALAQWFVLLHECGHGTLFRRRRLNAAVGFVAGVLAQIPAGGWRLLHARHHRWTGWQDVDPTTSALAPRPRSRLALAALDLAWATGLPFVSLHYRLRLLAPASLLRLCPRPARRRLLVGLAAHHLALVGVVAGLVHALGPAGALRLVGAALVLSWVLLDAVLLSQHTHVPQRVAAGSPVRPIPAAEQAAFTRSLAVPRWASALVLLGFEAHELHHVHPQVPGWRLRQVPWTPPGAVPWWRWIVGSRRLPGRVLLYRHRLETGAPL
ncbi:MAG: fatty acid desaturase [Planctomycetes bacterium]|nr:fatty acid desaturase [Planctomycetota bacterium]